MVCKRERALLLHCVIWSLVSVGAVPQICGALDHRLFVEENMEKLIGSSSTLE